jgi:hypothetical protein
MEMSRMLAMPGMRAFSLSPDRVSTRISCGTHGAFVGNIALLKRMRGDDGRHTWIARSVAELNAELTSCYRLPVDVSIKSGALALIANALNRGDVAMAAIAAVQMQFPDPPTTGDVSVEALMQLALELQRSYLLKGAWDPTKHPRRGSPPNRGWFAPVEGESTSSQVDSGRPRPNISPKGWPSNYHRSQALEYLKDIAGEVVRIGGKYLISRTPLGLAIIAFVKGLGETELNRGESAGIIGEQRLIDQMVTSFNPPKTLEELQQRPTENVLGYEQHHIVEQNDYNLEKAPIVKFGPARIKGLDNVVWVPRLNHEKITADYNSNIDGPGSPTFRESIRKLDFEQQREIGLEKLRKFGVLK